MGDDGGVGIDVLRVSQLLTDEYSIKILVATVRQPKSAQDIANKFGIPIAATYRRIKDLEAAGLIVCQERRLSQQGKRVSYYLSMLKNAYVFFEDGSLRVKFQLKTGGADRFGDDWHEVQLDPSKGDDKDREDK
ncbi:MAG: winged helix-turn-helix transcriptional regulator [Methanomassiliicoccus sp.]|nr:winged helix-turn-helix transcriptional regulator [Methanomassiliicoccus sp.]